MIIIVGQGVKILQQQILNAEYKMVTVTAIREQ
jgi:hypothetical protein